MIGRYLVAAMVAFPLFGALAGISAAQSLFPQTRDAPSLALSDEYQAGEYLADEYLAPASVTISVRTASWTHSGTYLEDTEDRFTVPVYFARDDASIAREAHLALLALADEAAASPAVAITISAHGVGIDESAALRDMRAINVFDALSSMGIPTRVMALELDQGPGAARHYEMSNAI